MYSQFIYRRDYKALATTEVTLHCKGVRSYLLLDESEGLTVLNSLEVVEIRSLAVLGLALLSNDHSE